eukprot:TRINITY_DN5898_c0_g1_i3.p1 TRINITY_DN5898_c0_g1~~TRINITY_DN5898_c0_g1_i3.p1  ORF type:complete len:331 (-),score=35.14 TRINITY_DN5898_c0_g1_i3:166-1158(-)
MSQLFFFFFQAEDGIRDFCLSRGLGDVYKRQILLGKFMKLCLKSRSCALYQNKSLKQKIYQQQSNLNTKEGNYNLNKSPSLIYSKKPIIKDVDLLIKGKTFVTIVGEIGSGKTTLIKLLLRFIDPEKGRVLIDGQDLKQLNIESFRKYISTVSQQTYIFNDTIMYNLKYASKQKTNQEIINICKALKLHEYIMSLPQQYDTKIGDQGNQFSGGERQRLAIARCLLKDTPILLLDEATSNLDSNYEDNVTDILKEIKKNRTIVLVTHRLRLGSQADKVIFLKKSGGVNEGTHEQLLEEDQEYRLMCRQLNQVNECFLCQESVLKNKDKHDQ